MSSDMDILRSLLGELLSPVNEVRVGAELRLNELKATHPRTLVMNLVAVVCDDANKEPSSEWTRSLGIILLKGITNREAEMWKELNPEEFASARGHLLCLLRRETVSRVKRLLILTLASLARLEQWDDLMACVGQLASSEIESDKVLGITMLDKLAEYIGSRLITHLETVASFLCPVLNRVSSQEGSSLRKVEELNTMVAAAQALCSLMHEMDEEEYAQHPICQYLLAAAHTGLFASNEDVFSSLVSLARDRPRLFQQSFSAMSQQVLLPLISSESAEGGMKSLALDMGCTLLVHTECRREEPFSDHSLKENFLNMAMVLATAIDTSEFSSEDEAVTAYFSDDGGAGTTAFFDDGSNEEDPEDNVACQAIANLESMARTFDGDMIVQICLKAAWGQVDSPDWRARRAGLVIAALVTEGTADALRPLMPDLVPKVLQLSFDSHPRVRYSALRCLVNFLKYVSPSPPVEEEGYDAEDAELDDQCGAPAVSGVDNSSGDRGHNESSFRVIFGDTIPIALCSVIEQNSVLYRILHAAMHCVRLFFDPDQCQYSACKTEGTDKATDFTLNLCLSILQAWGDGSGARPMYLVTEAASLLGNLYGSRFGPALAQSHYAPQDRERYKCAVTMMRAIVGDIRAVCPNPGIACGDTLQYNSLRCRCLESIAIICKAVGREISRGEAVFLLNDLVAAMQQEGGLDYSNPLSSYISQTTVRLAGVLADEFQPYVSVAIPTLLCQIEAPDEVSVTLADEGEVGASLQPAPAPSLGSHTEVLYKRGTGMVRVTHNPHQLEEKLMACRVLYQYILDISPLLGPYAKRGIHALIGLTDSLAYNEEGGLVVATAVSDLVQIYADGVEAEGREVDEQVFTLVGLVDALLGQLPEADDGELPELLDTLGNCLRTLGPLIQ